MNKIERTAADLLERLHPGQPWWAITIDDWTLKGSHAARKVAEYAEWIKCDPMDLVRAAERLIAEDEAEIAALEAEDLRREAEEEALLG